MKITVIGTGHVGLVVGGCLAEIGNDVLCLDSDPSKIEALRAGRSPFFEPDLEPMVQRNQKAGRLAFTLEIKKAVAHSEVIFLCLGTPPLPSGEADLSVVERVTRQIATLADGYKLVIGKSTVPVLTGQRIQKTMQLYSRGTNGQEFDVASNPEFLAEGSAVFDFLYPDRIVVGVESQKAEKLLREIYAPVVRQDFPWNLERPNPRNGREIPLVVTNRNSAELIKHASNSFLATKISYINAVANLCDKVGADVEQVAHGMGLDHRIGPQFLRAGIGFGGFCFPKDLQAFVWIANKNGYDFQLLREVEKINVEQIEAFLQKLRTEVWVLGGKTIAAWGLAFKPNTDDLRFSPAIAVIEKLLEQGSKIRAYDPKAMEEARKELPALTYCSSAMEAAEGADALLLLTEWPEFKSVDLAALRSKMARPLILDGRNFFDAQKVRAAGFEYASMGRP
jgi:UDPglucose 6-dehydrogenase